MESFTVPPVPGWGTPQRVTGLKVVKRFEQTSVLPLEAALKPGPQSRASTTLHCRHSWLRFPRPPNQSPRIAVLMKVGGQWDALHSPRFPLTVSNLPAGSVLPPQLLLLPPYASLNSEKACLVGGPEAAWWVLDDAAVLLLNSAVEHGWSAPWNAVSAMIGAAP